MFKARPAVVGEGRKGEDRLEKHDKRVGEEQIVRDQELRMNPRVFCMYELAVEKQHLENKNLGER